MNLFVKLSALAAASATLATAVPATAAVAYNPNQTSFVAPGVETFNDHRDWGRDRRYSRDDYRRGYGDNYRQSYRDDRGWRGDRRDYYRRDNCRRGSGTTGLILGGGAGALLGRSIDGGRDRTLGTVLGAAGGALLGREVDRGGSRCR